ncbi:MAG: DUF421 domain-containing protein [Sphingobacteriaceae bacterium]|nr:DUF421 domain-containing protein [Sphingobacteriaceae bacterium]
MRAKNIEHIGQVQTAFLESNGQVSFIFTQQIKGGRECRFIPRRLLNAQIKY